MILFYFLLSLRSRRNSRRFAPRQSNRRNETPRSIDAQSDQSTSPLVHLFITVDSETKTATILSQNNYLLHMNFPVDAKPHARPKLASETTADALEGQHVVGTRRIIGEIQNKAWDESNLGYTGCVSRINFCLRR